MGGFGSGPKRFGAKSSINDYRYLDIRRLRRDGLLQTGKSTNLVWEELGQKMAYALVLAEDDQLKLTLKIRNRTDDWHAIEYVILIVWRPCNYGGHSAHFVCPAKGCLRRVAKLYFSDRQGLFRCRACHNLVYPSQRESHDVRLLTQIENIRRRLEWPAGKLHANGIKPKGMHWRTFQKLRDRYQELVIEMLSCMSKRIAPLEKHLNRIRDDLRV